MVVARDLAEMVKDGDFDAGSYITFATQLLTREKELLVIEFVLKTAVHIVNNYLVIENRKEQSELLYNLIIDHLYISHKELKNTFLDFMLSLIDAGNYEQIAMLLYYLKKEPEKVSLLRGESETLEQAVFAKSYDLTGISEVTIVVKLF